MRMLLQEPNAEDSWQSLASCIESDPDLFFPERGASTNEAKRICRACLVREECLEYALTNGEKFGIWGGLDERQRRHVRRERAAARREARSAAQVTSGDPSVTQPGRGAPQYVRRRWRLLTAPIREVTRWGQAKRGRGDKRPAVVLSLMET